KVIRALEKIKGVQRAERVRVETQAES
ncbi:MAG: hypothetical protein H6Q41_1045, partial [Deltaproteobacteria bacterium]|nr:hypothetical protein [Deltaproteobacteria bacterium]